MKLSASTATSQHDLDPDSAKKRVNPLSCIEGNYCALETKPLENGIQVVSSAKVLSPCRCESQWCEDCRGPHAWAWRDKLRPVVASWEACTMITLTIDQSKWKDAQEAYLGIQAKRGVAQFVRKLYSRGLIETKEFFYAIEFHKNGWTHWHLAVRGRNVVPSHLNGVNMFLDSGYELAELWKYGMVNVSAPPEEDYYTPEHAMNYLTKYVAKQEVGPPDWIMDSDLKFNKFSTSRGLCGKSKPRRESINKREAYAKRTPRERAEACAKSSRLMECVKTELHNENGVEELSRKYRFLIDVDEEFAAMKGSRKTATDPQAIERWKWMQEQLDGRKWTDEHPTVDLWEQRRETDKKIVAYVSRLVGPAEHRNGLSEERMAGALNEKNPPPDYHAEDG